jgi:hypothetical protein
MRAILAVVLALLALVAPGPVRAQGLDPVSLTASGPPELREAVARMVDRLAAGDMPAALPLSEHALSLSRAALGEAHPATVRLGIEYGDLLGAAGQDAAAAAFHQSHFATVQANFLPWSPLYVMAELSLARALGEVGENAQALSLVMGVVQRVGGFTGANSPATMTILQEAARILRHMGYLEEALAAYRAMVPVFDGAGTPEGDRLAAGAQFAVADILDRLEGSAAALDTYRDAEARHIAAYGPDHPGTLSAQVGLGLALHWTEQWDELDALIARATPRAERVFGRDGIEYASWLRLGGLSLFRLGAGDQPAARALMAAAVAVTEARLPETHRVLGELRQEYAQMLLAMGEVEAAWVQFEKSTAALRPSRKDLLDILWARQQRGQIDEAAFAALALPYLHRTAQGLARGAVREQALRGLIRDPAVAATYREATDLIEERRALQADLAALAGRPLAQADRSEEARLTARYADVTAAIEAKLAAVDAAEPSFAALKGDSLPDIPALQALLGPDEALVLIDQQRDDNEWSVAIAITPQAAAARVFWYPAAETEAAVQAVRDSVALTLGTRSAEPLAGPAAAAPDAVFPYEASVLLFERSFGQVGDLVSDRKHIYLEVRGPLSGIPPGLMLPDLPEGDRTPANAPWLIRYHALTVLPSVASLPALVAARGGTPAPEAFAGFADPSYDAQALAGDLLAAADAGATQLRGALKPLPETAGEAEAVRAAVAAGGGELSLGRRASEAAVKRGGLERFRMVYFATHGLVGGDRAGDAVLAEPALALTPGEGEDGFLTATEVAGLRLNADFVVLSACNTAVGTRPGAEPLSGLAQAFLYAGARALLVSHWPVESKSAVALMTDLFRIRAASPGLGAARAQQAAIVAMIDNPANPRWSHPAYWAPFILVGSPDRG